MGVFKMFSSGSYGVSKDAPIAAGNPNPRHFKILLIRPVGDHLMAKVRYPDCNNYEGIKILVFLNTSPETLLKADFVDPHFTDQDTLKPSARFEPTEQGWRMARVLLESMLND